MKRPKKPTSLAEQIIGPSARAKILRRLQEIDEEKRQLEAILAAVGKSPSSRLPVGAVLTCIKEHPGKRITELYELLPQYSNFQIQDAIRRLQARSKIRIEGRRKYYKYFPKRR